MMSEEKVVYLMRGLPACGKSYTARRLAGVRGLVFETDEYFYTTRPDGSRRYVSDETRLPEARRSNLERFKAAVDQGLSPLVVDRGNGLNRETQDYARHAVEHDYRVELQEPESPWWQEIRLVLQEKERAGPVLDRWAEELARISRLTHWVPAATIRLWMSKWRSDLTVEEILTFEPGQKVSG